MFLDAVNRNALEEGTVIEINVTSPDGKRYETNLKLNRDDLDFLRAMGELSSHSR